MVERGLQMGQLIKIAELKRDRDIVRRVASILQHRVVDVLTAEIESIRSKHVWHPPCGPWAGGGVVRRPTV